MGVTITINLENKGESNEEEAKDKKDVDKVSDKFPHVIDCLKIEETRIARNIGWIYYVGEEGHCYTGKPSYKNKKIVQESLESLANGIRSPVVQICSVNTIRIEN